jgi:DNA-directed RNA polymerase subunit RPC12/RpoP
MRNPKSVQGLKAEDTQKCPECGSKNITKEKGEIYCNKCGFVISD